MIDASWALNNPAKRTDYAYRGTHVAAVAGKALSHAYYGTAPRHAYFDGCSNGGRQALMEAQRYPEDFDGIIAGDPSFGTLGQLRRTLVYQTLLSSPEHLLSSGKVALLANAVLKSCDALDGLADGLITDPRSCNFTPESLKCAGADGPDCLTSAQIETVNAIHGDLKGPFGRTLVRFPLGHEDGATGWQAWVTGVSTPERRADGTLALSGRTPAGYSFQDGYLKYLAFAAADGTFDWRTFNADRDGSKLQPFMDEFSPTNPDLSKLRARGGKLILYHGWADPALSALGTIAYYEDVVKNAGGPHSKRSLGRTVHGARHAPLPGDRAGTEQLRHADRARRMGRTRRSAVSRRRLTYLEWDRRSHEAALSVSAGREVPWTRQHRSGGEFRVCRTRRGATGRDVRATHPGPRVHAFENAVGRSGSCRATTRTNTSTARRSSVPQEFEGRRLEDVTAREIADAAKKRQEDTLENAKFFGGDPEGRIGNSEGFRDIYEVSRGGRPWLVVDPPDGRIPPMKPDARAPFARAARRRRA